MYSAESRLSAQAVRFRIWKTLLFPITCCQSEVFYICSSVQANGDGDGKTLSMKLTPEKARNSHSGPDSMSATFYRLLFSLSLSWDTGRNFLYNHKTPEFITNSGVFHSYDILKEYIQMYLNFKTIL